jgi:hypothetical protein
MLFRKNEKVNEFLSIWNEAMQKNPDTEIKSGLPTGDQATLNHLLKEKDLFNRLKINYVLFPNKVYNARP